jgi:hypothetical protein
MTPRRSFVRPRPRVRHPDEATFIPSNEVRYWGATLQKTRLSTQTISSKCSVGLLRGRNSPR